jgi:23S rRNA (cytidine1920-2'-O)/16S rRNA (cytidine1409-2'-O)-methyltransferase
MKIEKKRLDDLLVLKGIADSKTIAQSLIISGRIYVGEKKLNKPGHSISIAENIIFRGPLHPWVSRGGIKLAHALEEFALSVEGLIALDIGASTGGFTDVLLRNGAEKIYAVDVGYGQLHEKLLNSSKVISIERTNARYINNEDIKEDIDIIVCDVSFISLKTILPESLKLSSVDAKLIALIKPQFEVGKKYIGKRGVVRDKELRESCCKDIKLWLENSMDWKVTDIIESPIKGRKGNIEYLIYAHR